MSLPTARNQIKASLQHLLMRWDETRQQWDDPASRAFEKDFLAPMEPPARSALAAMDAMADLLHKARRDCSE